MVDVGVVDIREALNSSGVEFLGEVISFEFHEVVRLPVLFHELREVGVVKGNCVKVSAVADVLVGESQEVGGEAGNLVISVVQTTFVSGSLEADGNDSGIVDLFEFDVHVIGSFNDIVEVEAHLVIESLEGVPGLFTGSINDKFPDGTIVVCGKSEGVGAVAFSLVNAFPVLSEFEVVNT